MAVGEIPRWHSFSGLEHWLLLVNGLAVDHILMVVKSHSYTHSHWAAHFNQFKSSAPLEHAGVVALLRRDSWGVENISHSCVLSRFCQQDHGFKPTTYQSKVCFPSLHGVDSFHSKRNVSYCKMPLLLSNMSSSWSIGHFPGKSWHCHKCKSLYSTLWVEALLWYISSNVFTWNCCRMLLVVLCACCEQFVSCGRV